MLFTEFRFLVFFAVVFAFYWSLKDNTARKLLLLVGSYIFYAAWNSKYLGLIAASTIVDYLIGLRLGALTPVEQDAPRSRTRHLWIALSVCWNLGVLAYFKYTNFGIDSAQHLLGWLGLHPSLHTLNIILPVGISFFTFQSMSYSIDIYRGTLQPSRDLLDFSTFIGFFPQLFAGPIVRAIDFLPQLKTPRRLVDVRGRAMLAMFLIGYIKKTCVADNLAPFVDDYFANPGKYNWLGCWTAVLFYAAQIYCDFSGYTDMAIASAGLLGYEFVQNFDFPYFAPNIAIFWRKWHMSLSSWLRDYLYIPLGGNRGNRLFQHRNLLLTMLLGGLWHGAAWTYVIWGGMHGIALIVHREFRGVMKRIGLTDFQNAAIAGVVATLGALLTFLWVSLTWVFFRAKTLPVAWSTAKSFVLFRSLGTQDFGYRCVIAFAALAVIHLIFSRKFLIGRLEKIPAWQFAAACGIVFALALPWTPLGFKPFIYFQF